MHIPLPPGAAQDQKLLQSVAKILIGDFSESTPERIATIESVADAIIAARELDNSKEVMTQQFERIANNPDYTPAERVYLVRAICIRKYLPKYTDIIDFESFVADYSDLVRCAREIT